MCHIRGYSVGERKINPKSLENLRPPFSAENQPDNPGRKKSKVKEFTKGYELSYDDIASLAKYVLSMDEAEIGRVAKNKEAPMILRLFCRYLMEDMKKGVASNINMLMDRAVGKVRQDVGLSGTMNIFIDGDDAGL